MQSLVHSCTRSINLVGILISRAAWSSVVLASETGTNSSTHEVLDLFDLRARKGTVLTESCKLGGLPVSTKVTNVLKIVCV
mmetsp:Transcript_24650/g.34270  ORF Transcript_24650/g.34270 Transcript_24650/m.34270 type:complete len:81 (-) Transcript_24650:97-339(-)